MNIFDHEEDTLRDYCKPDFRSLGPLVSILQSFEQRHSGFRSYFLGPLVKSGGLLDPNFGKKIIWDIFDRKKDTLGTILSLISGI